MGTYTIGVALVSKWDLDLITFEGTRDEALNIADGIEVMGKLGRTERDITCDYMRIRESQVRAVPADEHDIDIVFTRTWVDPSI